MKECSKHVTHSSNEQHNSHQPTGALAQTTTSAIGIKNKLSPTDQTVFMICICMQIYVNFRPLDPSATSEKHSNYGNAHNKMPLCVA